MNMIPININIATREKVELVECCSTALAEDLCTIVCRSLHISPIATTLFALRLPDSNVYLPPNARVEKYSNLVLRIRFRVPNLTRLKNLDVQAHNYYFHQVKNDVLENRIPEIVYAKHRDELLGLGITDMYRLMVEEKKNREEVEKDYRKYIPREVIKRHKMFTKKPIHTTLAQFAKSGYADAGFIKEQYLKKLNSMAPNYLSEEYEVLYVSNAVNHQGVLHVMPFHKDEPGLRMHNKTKKEWEYLCTIDELCFMSSGQDENIEISRINGRPVYLKFPDQQRMLSFISVCDGYYRLMVKWTFNLCKVVTSPALQLLHDMKCHGPVGGEFSYHKLEEKRANKPGCFILRQCEKYFDTFYIDVCSKTSTKPETYKIEKRGNTYTLHETEVSEYPSWTELISKHRLPDGNIYLQECLPPSEYDKSQVLLCEDVGRGVGGKIGQDTLEDMLANIKGPRCIHTKDILVFKSPYCFTEDTSVPVDLCDVSDCNDDKHSALVFISPADENNMFLIFPEWKFAVLKISLKVWDTERQEGLIIKIFPQSRKEHLSFEITKDGQKIILSHVDQYNYTSYLKQEISPELIPIGQWGKYWFRFARGSILFGYKGVKREAFKWVDKKEKHTFEPLYVTFLPVEHHPIGMIFPNKECLIEKTTSNKIFRIMSLGVWETKKKALLTLHLRGNGKANILLSLLPNTRVASSENLSLTYKALWQVAQSKKFEVAMKMLKQDASSEHMKEFIDKAGQWAFLKSSALVRLYGVILRSPVAMVLEFLPIGPLDVYLRENKKSIRMREQVEAAASLASALWSLAESGFVHGNIRCRKLLVAGHDNSHLSIKLSDPGLHSSYGENEYHWLPVEFFNNMNAARMSPLADVWAFATTLWEIFSFGLSPAQMSHSFTKKNYVVDKRTLEPPVGCPHEVYVVMQSCWHHDQHRRARAQVIMRDINHLHYQVHCSHRNVYETVSPKSNLVTGSAQSLTSNVTGESMVDGTLLTEASEIEHQHYLSMRSTSSSQSDVNTTMTFDGDDDDSPPYDFSDFTSHTQMQNVLELDKDCNIIMQGRIGQGYYGEVFRGTMECDNSESRQVAIKKLKQTAQTATDDFEREIEIMKSLKHKNIVEIIGVLEYPEVQLIMEFVPNGSLQTYLHFHRDCTVHQLLKYACDVAVGMEYLGKLNIVHRDLAARNILVVSEDHVKISDFGLAQFMHGDYYILKTNRELPLKWYAPESVSDGKFSTKSDVWSYGVTLFEMFSFGVEPPAWGPEIASQDDRFSKLACPPFCPVEVYVNMFLPCWKFTPTERATFTELIIKCKELGTQFC